MRIKIICGLMVLTVCLLMASIAFADKLVCISNENLRGEMTVNNCLLKGEKFAIVDQYGGVRMISPEEAAVMKKLNPKLFEGRTLELFGDSFTVVNQMNNRLLCRRELEALLVSG